MNALDFAEYNSREAAKFSKGDLDVARSRAHAVLVLLLGGGAGLGMLGLGQWAQASMLAWAAWVALLRRYRKRFTQQSVNSFKVCSTHGTRFLPKNLSD